MTEIEISNEEALTQMMLRRAKDLKADNVLIAEFMGHKLGLDGDGMGEPQCRIFEKGLGTKRIEDTYSTSWDWLMPVVNKCLNIYHVEQMNDDLNFKFYDSMGNINTTYNVVVEFINQLKNK